MAFNIGFGSDPNDRENLQLQNVSYSSYGYNGYNGYDGYGYGAAPYYAYPPPGRYYGNSGRYRRSSRGYGGRRGHHGGLQKTEKLLVPILAYRRLSNEEAKMYESMKAGATMQSRNIMNVSLQVPQGTNRYAVISVPKGTNITISNGRAFLPAKTTLVYVGRKGAALHFRVK